MQTASSTGPDPFTPSTGNGSAPSPPASAAPTASSPAGGYATRTVNGSAPGLYGGTEKVSSCDVGQLIGYLSADPAKERAWAQVEGIDPGRVPAYIRSLTPALLRADTRVTNHGYRNGSPTAYQSIMQAGTAVLVDSHGVPRVRCACGNPLTPPVALAGDARRIGRPWPGFQPTGVIAIAPAPQPMKAILIVDVHGGGWFERPVGGGGHNDKPVPPPSVSPSGSASTSGSASASASASASRPGSASASASASASPSSSSPPSSRPPSPAPPPPSSAPARSSAGKTPPSASKASPGAPSPATTSHPATSPSP